MKRIALAVLAAILATLVLTAPARASSTAPSINVISTTSASATIGWSYHPSRFTVAWTEKVSPYRYWESGRGGYAAKSSPLTLTGLHACATYTVWVVPVENGTNAWWDAGRTSVTTSCPGREALHVVCASEGGNARYWISFKLRGARPAMNSAKVRAFADTARDGWIALPKPSWVQPGTVVTSIAGTSNAHGSVSQIRLTYGALTASPEPNPYGEDCSFAGFPSM